MTILLWLGVVLLGCGWLFVVPVFQRADPTMAVLVFATGVGSLWLAGRRAGGMRRPFLSALVLLGLTSTAHLWVDPLVYLVASRVHRLDVVAPLAAVLLRLVGCEVHLGQGVVHVAAPSHLLPFTCNWEKLGLLPAVWIGLVGGVACLALRRPRPVRSLALFAATTGCYLLLRFVTLVVLFLEHPDPRNLEASDASSMAMFQAPLHQFLSFLPLAFVLATVMPWRPEDVVARAGRGSLRGRGWHGAALLAAGAAAVVAFFQYQDPGERKAGRILFDEYHSQQWESVARPLDTEWYGRESVYNYATFTEFLRQYYDVAVNLDAAYDDQLLADYDVLVVKTTTLPFASGEIDAIVRFVEGGGGLLLIGDHTDLLGMTTNMNQLVRRFGMAFNLDAANRLDDGHLHTFTTHPLFPHPATDRMPGFEFMTSCTLDAPLTAESVMIGSNTFSDPLDYSAPSFFGNVIVDTEDDFGIHLLAAARKQGAGRVLAFTDGTVFSSFGVMFEGRPEFLLGSMGYLDRRNTSGYLWNRVSLAAGLVLLLAGCWRLRGHGPEAWSVGVTAGLGVGVVLGGALTAWHMRSHLPPPPLRDRATTILFPKRWGDVQLPAALGHLHDPPSTSFDTFFVWTQRLGYLPRVLDLEDGLPIADAVVIINPTHGPDAEELASLTRFVDAGGRLLVMDSIWNRDSTANAILAPFGLRVSGTTRTDQSVFADPEWVERNVPAARDGTLEFGGYQAAPLAGALPTPGLTLLGGTALYRTDDDRNLVTSIDKGRGRVIALVDSIAFSRLEMGEQVEEPPPGDPKRERYAMEYSLLRDHLLADPQSPDGDGAPPSPHRHEPPRR